MHLVQWEKVIPAKEALRREQSKTPDPDYMLHKWAEYKTRGGRKVLWKWWTGEELPLQERKQESQRDILSRRLAERKEERELAELVKKPTKIAPPIGATRVDARGNGAYRGLRDPNAVWKTLDGQPLPYTPTEVWQMYHARDVKELEENVNRATRAYVRGLASGGLAGFAAPWLIYLLITGLYALLKWAINSGYGVLKWVCDDGPNRKRGDGMNRKQLIVLWVGIVVFVLVTLNPRSGYRGEIRWWPASLLKLLASWGIVVVVTGGLIVTLRNKKDDKPTDKEREG